MQHTETGLSDAVGYCSQNIGQKQAADYRPAAESFDGAAITVEQYERN
jgi:hypothetical protein